MRCACHAALLVVLSLGMVVPGAAYAAETYRFERLWPTLQQPWYFFRPTHIAVDHDNHVYVTDTENNRIQKLNSDGQFITTWGSRGPGPGQFYNPSGIAVDTDGYVYVSDSWNDRIQKFTSNGAFVAAWGTYGSAESQFSAPEGIAIGVENHVYVADYGNDRIQEFSSEGEFVRTWGEDGIDPGQFVSPSGIAVGLDGSVYVSDVGTGLVQRFTAEGAPLGYWDGSQGTAGVFGTPWDVTADREGNVYVADTDNSRIQVFTAEGEFRDAWGESGSGVGQFRQPFGLASDDTGRIYVVDRLGQSVQKFTAGGEVLDRWGSKGRQAGFMDLPAGAALGPNGDVYVSDTQNQRVQRFSADGRFLLQWGSRGNGEGQFLLPFGIAVDASGFVYVVDYDGSNVQKFDENGVFQAKWGSPGSGDGQFAAPTAVAIDSGGNVYITDMVNDRVQKFRPDGQYLGQWGVAGSGEGHFDTPIGIAIASDDRVYVADSRNHRIQEFTTDGDLLNLWGYSGTGDGGFDEPKGIAVDQDGNVYVADTNNNRIQKFSADGSFLMVWGQEGTNPGDMLHPAGLAIGRTGAAAGRVYVADQFNARIQVFKPVPVVGNARAIIVAAGGDFDGNNLWDATQLCANFVYRTLTYQGFDKDSIYYLSSDLDLDLDGNGQPDDVDADATNANLQSAITTWAGADGVQSIVLYLVDHGGDGSFRMSGTETLAASDLDAWLDTLQDGAAPDITGSLTVVYEACQSGSFQSILAPATGQNRIVVTSTTIGENAYFLSQGTISFSIFFWTHIFNGSNVLEAYTLANQAMTQAIDTQHPLLADSPGDGSLADATFLGNGTVILGDAPVIGAVSPEQLLTGASEAALWADPVTDPDGVARVWAVLRPPNFQSPSPDNPVQELPTFELQPMGGGRYEASYPGFSSPGLYQIAIYARDRLGNAAAPRLTTVAVESPLKRKAIIVGGMRESDPLWPAYENTLGRAYHALKVQGYTDSTIAFRSPVTFDAGIDGAPSLSNLEYLLTVSEIYDTYDLVLYLVGSATAAGFEINTMETLTAADLVRWLDIAQDNIPGPVTVVCDTTDSGTFLTQLQPPAEKQRIVLSSTRPGESAHFLSGGDLSFSSYFWTSVLNGAKVWDAFKQAQIAMRFSGSGQFAVLDDTGNGVGNEKVDGVLARNHTIGAGIQLAGDDPVVGSVGTTPALLTSGTSATVWAEGVTSTGAIASVFATITPPGGGAPVEIELFDAGGGRYEADYDAFDYYGDYVISITAVDAAGGVSLPAEAVLRQSGQPDAFEEDDTLAQANLTGVFGETGQHNFHDTGDEDWLRFYAQSGARLTIKTLNLEADCDTEIALFQADGNPVIDPDTSLPVVDDDGSAEPLASFYILVPDQTGYYYLRVRYSPFGAGAGFGVGTGYEVRITQEIGDCVASASLTVYVSSGGADIAGASVTLSVTPVGGAPYSETQTTSHDGEAGFPMLGEEGTYNILVQKSGYQNFSTSRVVACGETASVDARLTATSSGPRLVLAPASLEYGQVAVGTTRDLSTTVTNSGTGTLSGSASTSGAYSLIGDASYSLAAGQTKTLTVRFSPGATQSFNSALAFTGGGSMPLSGAGFDPTPRQIGDVNTDSQINALDATLINLYLLVGESSLDNVLAGRGMNAFSAACANVDLMGSGNGVTARDATLLNLELLMGRTALNNYLISIGQPRSHAGEPLE